MPRRQRHFAVSCDRHTSLRVSLHLDMLRGQLRHAPLKPKRLAPRLEVVEKPKRTDNQAILRRHASLAGSGNLLRAAIS